MNARNFRLFFNSAISIIVSCKKCDRVLGLHLNASRSSSVLLYCSNFVTNKTNKNIGICFSIFNSKLQLILKCFCLLLLLFRDENRLKCLLFWRQLGTENESKTPGFILSVQNKHHLSERKRTCLSMPVISFFASSVTVWQH